jgi:hypothetical protein
MTSPEHEVIDRTGWPPGPWDDEPDRVDFPKLSGFTPATDAGTWGITARLMSTGNSSRIRWGVSRSTGASRTLISARGGFATSRSRVSRMISGGSGSTAGTRGISRPRCSSLVWRSSSRVVLDTGILRMFGRSARSSRLNSLSWSGHDQARGPGVPDRHARGGQAVREPGQPGGVAVSPTRRRQLSAEYEQSVNAYILRLERENAALRASLDQKDRDLADCSRRLRGRP